MLFIFGKRTARIGIYNDKDHICYPCKAYDREIRVYRSYLHICFIPVFPIGVKQFEMRCGNCGDETRMESVIAQYDKRTPTPVYLYSALFLFAGITFFWFYWNKNMEKNKKEFVGKPAAGDVYTIRKEKNDETAFYFLRIVAVQGDSVKVLHNNLDYGGFVSSLAENDFFVKEDTMVYKKKELSGMLERGDIYSVDRSYGNGTGFNRLK